VLRTIKAAITTVALATPALFALPTAAAAAAAATASGPAPVFSCDHCQFAGGDILNAGRDITVGSSAADQSPSPTSTIVVTNLTNPMVRVSQTGIGDYPLSMAQDTPAFFSVDIPSSATYRFGDDLATIEVSQAGVSCQTSGGASCQVSQGDVARVVIG
jgi:hypothetical protein